MQHQGNLLKRRIKGIRCLKTFDDIATMTIDIKIQYTPKTCSFMEDKSVIKKSQKYRDTL